MSAVQTEHVLVVPTDEFHRVGHFQGFSAEVDRYLDQLLRPALMSFRPRPVMESDPSFKQLIPYVIVRHRDRLGKSHVFHYTRGQGQGEQRLHAKLSVGVGGHICTEDVDSSTTDDPYSEGLRRELQEELIIDTDYRLNCVGLINDDETEVGRVHLGVVHLMEVDQPAIRSREDAMLEAGFRPVDELWQQLPRMETWSSLCLKALFG